MLHVKGGKEDTSYASNSLLQRKVISMTWPIAKKAIIDFFGSNSFPSTTLTVADLGCSSGSNTLMFVSNLIKLVESIRQEDQFVDRKKPLEFQILLNDLRENDFNGIFTCLPSFLESLKSQVVGGCDVGPCFFNGVPGSFYGRLFPTQSLHFVYSSYSLHWLSQVPKGIDESNKGNVYIDNKTPKSVCEAYYKQFKDDFSMFLKCRAQEVIYGGRMVLTIVGRTTEDPCTENYCYVWGFLTLALNDMAAEGIVEEIKVKSFNIPSYMPSPLEVKGEILKEGSFSIQCLEVSKVDWNSYNKEELHNSSSKDNAYYITKGIRSVIEPVLVHHFEEALDIEDLFCRYRKIVHDHILIQKIEFINLTVSLTKTN